MRHIILAALLLTCGCDDAGDDPPSMAPDASTEADASLPDADLTDADLTDADLTDAGPDTPACDPSPQPRAGRLLGIDLLDVSADDTFDTNLQRADELDVDFITLHLTWAAFEAPEGSPDHPYAILRAFKPVLDAADLKMSLTIRPIDLTGKTVPPDLEDARFNDPQMAARFTEIVDRVFEIIPPSQLTSLQIGNEIDGFDASNEHPEFWSDYGAFLAAIVAHVHNVAPGLAVGFTGTLPGLTEGQLHDLGVWQAYAGVVDVIGVTYYPLDGAFQVQNPLTRPAQDLNTLVSTFPGRRILLQEVGFPSSPENGSSPEAQATFYCALLAAWDDHAAAIELANIVRLYDVTQAGAEVLAGPYGLTDASFVAFLRTLGIRTHGEEGKEAYEAVLNGWDRRR